ncbi:hypothetical protein MMC28_000458 [Mycoblastus sanguinarius]|nr:hypothetical protein [Mycoblastus sanguinarius]
MPNATDIITYIGVPLAVLGVLPILYTAINSLFTIRRIKQLLKKNGLPEASTRGSLMSGVVEVSLPRFSITPLDRKEDPEYWKLNRQPSTLTGGSWTVFNWNCLITGSRLYRLQYSADLQVPQAEIDFEELMSFLLDRGAVPDVKGLHMLRVSGLWTPTGTSLMLSPDTMHSVLRISQQNDSDGIVSLALKWREDWDNRDPNYLPPGWMRLELSQNTSNSTSEEVTEKVSSKEKSVENPPARPRPMSLRFRLGHSGSLVTISDAIWEHENMPLPSPPSLKHLLIPHASFWTPSIALALGLSRSLPLYNHNLDPSISSLSTRDTVPCGVLVVLRLLPEGDVPPWETKYDPNEFGKRQTANFLASCRAADAERMMSPDQARIAKMTRQTAELHRMTSDRQESMERERERSVLRQREAIGSPRLETMVVANAALKELVKEKILDESSGLQAAVETLLVSIVKNKEQAMSVCSILERWREWSDRGGMTIDDFEMVGKNKLAFCNAACVMGLFREASTKEESMVASDMRECVRHWKNVRLG